MSFMVMKNIKKFIVGNHLFFLTRFSMCAFLHPTDPLLNMRAAEVPVHDIPTPAIQGLIDQMFEIARGERVDVSKPSMVGLAAPQIGIVKRVILVDVGTTSERNFFGELKAFINPQILWHSNEVLLDREGCFSVDRRIRGIVPRFESIKVVAYDRYGNPVAEEISGFPARIFQHEIDHLEGIRFPDRVGENGTLHWVELEDFSHYKQNWNNWTECCPWHKWLDTKYQK
jgi:peptide deformylase